MFGKFFKKLFGDKQARDMKKIWPVVEEVNKVYEEYKELSEEDLQNKTQEFRRLLHAVPRISRIGNQGMEHEVAEMFLQRHPDVQRAVFLGTRRDFHPAELVAFVQLKEKAKPTADLASQVREGMARLGPDCKPKHVIFIDEFPTVDEKGHVDHHLLMTLIEQGKLDSWANLKANELKGMVKYESETPFSLDDIMPEAFAAIKEACRRQAGKKWVAGGIEIEWNMVPFDVQIAGGVALHRGNIAEMATGEGKTLTAMFALYLNGLSSKGSHLVTVNDYLAKRDSEWNGPIFEYLGLSVGCIDKAQPGSPQRRGAYRCDITYGTNNEFGFDYLRDNMAHERMQLVQREPNFAIIDEADSVLIDEARTPLIIAGPVDRTNVQFEKLLPAIRELVNRQQMLVSRFVKEAQEMLEKDPASWDAGYRLLQCYKGMPKHNRYMKLREEPRNQKLQDKVEADLMLEKRIRELENELYFTVDERNRQIDLSDKGREALSPSDPQYFALPDLVEDFAKVELRTDIDQAAKDQVKLEMRAKHEEKAESLHSISQLLHAFTLKRRDVDYVVEEEKVVIVDENTGRKMNGRRWSDGLHAAVEAKEGVKIEKETQTLATITIQNYFRLYKKRAGMTGTAETEAAEFIHTYGMDVIVIPTNKSTKRQDLDDVVYKTKREKYAAVIQEIERLHKMNLPILVGTTSVATSETVSRMLRTSRLSHAVLNAKNHAKEAEIILAAGQPGAITIATNMAGRGTDIKIGAGGTEPCKDPETGEDWPGGLQIIGTERHESRRIDRQLRGRSGRQGDPGTSRFFVSLEDDLMLWFGSERMAHWMSKLGLQEGEPIIHPWVTKGIGNAQKKVEGINAERRKRTLEYDDVMNKQRETIYKLRREILVEDDLREIMLDLFADALENEFRTNHGDPNNSSTWDIAGFADWLQRVLVTPNLDELRETKAASVDEVVSAAMAYVVDAYDQKLSMIGKEMSTALARYIALRSIDTEWQDHLLAIDALREGIGLRGYGQREPLLEFTKDATDMFSDMLLVIHKEIFDRYFRTQLVNEQEEQRRRAAQRIIATKPEATAGPSGEVQQPAAASADAHKRPPTGVQPYRREMPKVGRNDLCPCGSGKKYKDCHGIHEMQERVPAGAPEE